MVIAEALQEVKDLERKRQNAVSQLNKNVFILPSDNTSKSVESLLEEILSISSSIVKIKTAIQKANLSTIVDGKSLTEIIKDIEMLRNMETHYRGLIDTMSSKESRFMSRGYMGANNTPELVPNFNVSLESLEEQADSFRATVRKLERAMAKANWSTNIEY